jgi:hypothetical protein
MHHLYQHIQESLRLDVRLRGREYVDDGRRSARRALGRDVSRAPVDADVTAERIRTHDV